jgi:hypothetical protein
MVRRGLMGLRVCGAPLEFTKGLVVVLLIEASLLLSVAVFFLSAALSLVFFSAAFSSAFFSATLSSALLSTAFFYSAFFSIASLSTNLFWPDLLSSASFWQSSLQPSSHRTFSQPPSSLWVSLRWFVIYPSRAITKRDGIAAWAFGVDNHQVAVYCSISLTLSLGSNRRSSTLPVERGAFELTEPSRDYQQKCQVRS